MQLEKRNTFSNDIIFIDGLWGTGKSLLGPIVSGMKGVEKVKIESLYEYVSWLYHLGKFSEDGALWLLRSYADTSQYHNTIGREINLRWNDDTGLKNAPDKLKIIRRLIGKEGDSMVDEINSKNLAFCAMTHLLMLTPELLSPAYGDRVKVIEMVRHPLYMVDHFAAYLARFESPREFTMAFYNENIKVPWFANGWETEFVNANPTERAVMCITHLYPWLDKKILESQMAGLPVLILNFEEAVFETDKVLTKLEQFTSRKHHLRVFSILKKQKLPRKTIAKGKGHNQYGWKKDNRSEGEIYEGIQNMVIKKCSASLQNDLNETISWYNNKYPSRLVNFR
jgi:hypothetical protein